MQKRLTQSFLLFVLVLAASAITRPAGAADVFPFKDGDTWVMVGDSITAQHLHSNYFEAFCFARYPKLTFRFRNSGVGGDTIPKVLARFDWDVATWKPTVVSVELGMNDQGGFTKDQFISNMDELTTRIKSITARPVILTSSPINNGDTSAKLPPFGNGRLNEYAIALKSFSAEKGLPFADQFHMVIDVWGKNKPREQLANSLPVLRMLAEDKGLAGVEHLRAFLDAESKSPDRPVSMQGDPVHPGPPGQLIMAAALLKELGAEGLVSSLVLNAGGARKVVEAKGCTAEAVKVEGGTLAFDRTDSSSPFPIPDEARAVLPLFPTLLELSQYGLKVTGLSGERYTLQIDKVPVSVVTAKELEQGINLTQYNQGPVAAQGKAILAAVGAKEAIVNQRRGLARIASLPTATPEQTKAMADLLKQVEDADARIREAAQPRKLHFELIPLK